MIQKAGLRSLSKMDIKTKEKGGKASSKEKTKGEANGRRRTRQALKTRRMEKGTVLAEKVLNKLILLVGQRLCKQLTPQLGFWLRESPGDKKANLVQRCVCFPSGSLLPSPTPCLAWGLLRGHTFSACHTELGTRAPGWSPAAEDWSQTTLPRRGPPLFDCLWTEHHTQAIALPKPVL